MKINQCVKIIVLFSAFFFISPYLTAQNSDVSIKVIRGSLGEVIDAKENIRYNIFGDIPGFTAAKMYMIGAYRFQLHLLRNAQGRAKILILDLPFEKFSQLRKSIERRVNATLKENIRFDFVLYWIDESEWEERSENKKLVLRDGSELFVILVRAQRDTLVVQTKGGLQVHVPDVNIAKVIDLHEEIIGASFSRIDPNSSRLFFAPTGRVLNSGTGYFADYFVFFPTLAYGLTDFLSISGGMSLIPGMESQFIYFAPKLTLKVSYNVCFGTGFLHLTVPEEDDENLNLGYTVATICNYRSGLTLGAGFPLVSDSDQKPVLLIGGETQISNSAKLITENWIFTKRDESTVFSGGIRFFSDKLAVDLALITTEEAFKDGSFPFLPWVDFSVFFGK